MELKQIEPGATSFECQGKKFKIDSTLSFNRFEKLKEFSLEFGYSQDIKSIMIGLRKMWDMIQKGGEIGSFTVQLHNLMSSVVNLEQKTDVTFRIAALFINEENEDTTEYNESLIKEKISLWGKEYDVNFFFTFAISVVPQFIPVYKVITKDFSLKDELAIKLTGNNTMQTNSENSESIGMS